MGCERALMVGGMDSQQGVADTCSELSSLPKTVLSSDSVAVFKSTLKTFHFSQAFSSFSAH